MNQIRQHDWTLSRIETFTDIIDVRSPSEYDEDHIPGAVNLPVLDDAQRREVGTIHARGPKHEARRIGAAMVSSNIAGHLQNALRGKPPRWSPLVYCWRGGNRSAAMTYVMRRIGWKVESLTGGYKTYRRCVLEELDRLPQHLHFTILCGKTGVGKSLLLRKMANSGEQIIDLEMLAEHRGSVLGELPVGDAQPTQKTFESRLCHALRRQDPARIVYVEAESQRIGRLRVPNQFMHAIRAAPCWNIQADLSTRSAFLAREYQHFTQKPEPLKTAINKLAPFVGRAAVSRWLDLYTRGDVAAFIAALLTEYYDPIYVRSTRRNYACFDEASQIRLDELSDDAMTRAVEAIRRHR